MLVPPAPQHESAKNHRQANPNIDSYHYSTIPLIIAQPWKGCPLVDFKKGDATLAQAGYDGKALRWNFVVVRTGWLARETWRYCPLEVEYSKGRCVQHVLLR